MPEARSLNLKAGPDWRSEYRFESRYFDLGGVRYHYLDEGAGEPLLFVHGNPTWSFAWRHLVRELSATNRAIAVDHIGCGLSDKPQNYEYRLATHIANLECFIAGLDLKNITLVAHDWGGAIGMGVAGRMPHRFARFVLLNTAAFRSTRIPLRISVCRIPLLGALGVRGLNLFARAALSMAVEKQLPPDVCAGLVAPYDTWANRVAVQRFVEDIPLDPSHPSYKTLTEVEDGLTQFRDKPMLLIWGMRDWCFTPQFLEEFERRFPNATALRIPDAGHYVFEDAREQVLARIREFVSQV